MPRSYIDCDSSYHKRTLFPCRVCSITVAAASATNQVKIIPVYSTWNCKILMFRPRSIGITIKPLGSPYFQSYSRCKLGLQFIVFICNCSLGRPGSSEGTVFSSTEVVPHLDSPNHSGLYPVCSLSHSQIVVFERSEPLERFMETCKAKLHLKKKPRGAALVEGDEVSPSVF